MRKKYTNEINNIEKKSSKNNKKHKKFTTVIVASLCMALAGGTAVYAWFTLTNQAQVTSLSLQAGTTGGLKIGNSQNDVTHESISLETKSGNENYCVRPITSTDGTKFYRPVYGDNGVVKSVESTQADITSISNKTEGNGGYMLSYRVYLLAESKSVTGNVKIRLASDDADASHDGTYVKAGNSSNGAQAAMRMSFTANGTTSVYEPNANTVVNGSSDSQYKAGGWSNLATIKQTDKTSGLFAANKTTPGTNVDYSQTTSPELFEIKVNEVTPVTINIWLEGADKDCINDICASDMMANIQFICNELDE